MRASRLLFLPLLALAGCAGAGSAEVSLLECLDEDDNDGDELSDCNDPDCWSHAHCLVGGAGAAGQAGGLDAGTAGAGGGFDAGAGGQAGGPGSGQDADGGAQDASTDGPGQLPDSGADCDGCAGGGSCAVSCPLGPSDDLGQWSVASLTAVTPLWTTAVGAVPMCVDFDCPITEGGAFIPPACSCTPDPIVVIEVDGVQIGITPPLFDPEEAIWEQPGFKLPLLEGSEVTFHVFDSDAPSGGATTELFTCSTTVSAVSLADGVIECSGSDGTSILRRSYSVSARVVLP